jgi:hypothetical protein
MTREPTVTEPADLMPLIAKRFIQRRDDFSRQLMGGGYNPVRRPITVNDVVDHLNGTASYGHYLLDSDSHARVLCFDVDLTDGPGYWIQPADLSALPENAFTGPDAEHWYANNSYRHELSNVRATWQQKDQAPRDWIKAQMRKIAEMFSSRIHTELGIGTACTYSGSKGVHIYGFTGDMDAAEVREAALLIMASFDRFQKNPRSNNYIDTSTDQFDSFANFEIEVFPKQARIEEGGYGNLLRLPLGRNLKTTDPTFFLNQLTSHNSLVPASLDHTMQILETGNPWLDLS